MHLTSRLDTSVAAYVDAARRLDEEDWLATFADDVVSWQSGDAAPVAGREQLRWFLRATLAGFEHLELRPTGTLVAGNHAAVGWVVHGRRPDGHEARIGALDVIELDGDGRVRARWHHVDRTEGLGVTAAGQHTTSPRHVVPR